MIKQTISSIFTAFSLGLMLSLPYAPVMAAGKFDDTLNPMTFSRLPACTANSSGSRATISDFAGSNAWNATAVGGGTGTAGVYCDGSGSWKIYAGGASAQVASSAPILTAPTTTLGNYGTGCTSGNQSINGNSNYKCLLFDDHWNGTLTLNTSTVASSATAMNTTYWRSGHYQNQQYILGIDRTGQGGGFQYCGGNPGPFPFTSWTTGTVGNDYFDVIFNYPYGDATDPTAGFFTVGGQNDTNTPYLSKATDGSLLFNVAQNNYALTHALNGCQLPLSPAGTWVGATLTTAEATVAEIPHTGGMVQWSMKFDGNLDHGEYPGMECDADNISNGDNGTATNFNMEFGDNFIGTPRTNVAFSLDNTAVGTANFPTATGPAATNSGIYQVPANNDLTNWHTFAIEYSGDSGGALGTVRYYVDGTLVNTIAASAAAGNAAVASNGGAVANLGANYQCGWTQNIASNGLGGFHTIWDFATNGPFKMWVSDAQFWKKPGT